MQYCFTSLKESIDQLNPRLPILCLCGGLYYRMASSVAPYLPIRKINPYSYSMLFCVYFVDLFFQDFSSFSRFFKIFQDFFKICRVFQDFFDFSRFFDFQDFSISFNNFYQLLQDFTQFFKITKKKHKILSAFSRLKKRFQDYKKNTLNLSMILIAHGMFCFVLIFCFFQLNF